MGENETVPSLPKITSIIVDKSSPPLNSSSAQNIQQKRLTEANQEKNQKNINNSISLTYDQIQQIQGKLHTSLSKVESLMTILKPKEPLNHNSSTSSLENDPRNDTLFLDGNMIKSNLLEILNILNAKTNIDIPQSTIVYSNLDTATDKIESSEPLEGLGIAGLHPMENNLLPNSITERKEDESSVPTQVFSMIRPLTDSMDNSEIESNTLPMDEIENHRNILNARSVPIESSDIVESKPIFSFQDFMSSLTTSVSGFSGGLAAGKQGMKRSWDGLFDDPWANESGTSISSNSKELLNIKDSKFFHEKDSTSNSSDSQIKNLDISNVKQISFGTKDRLNSRLMAAVLPSKSKVIQDPLGAVEN